MNDREPRLSLAARRAAWDALWKRLLQPAPPEPTPPKEGTDAPSL